MIRKKDPKNNVKIIRKASRVLVNLKIPAYILVIIKLIERTNKKIGRTYIKEFKKSLGILKLKRR